MPNEAAYIAALLREREGCVRYGKLDRLPAIDAELKRMGYEAEPPAKRAEKRPAAAKRERRA